MLTRPIDLGLLILRLALGAFMIYGHGWGKLMKVLAGAPYEFGDPIGLGPGVSLFLAAFAEVICSLLLMLGLFTRWATIPLIITMAVALLSVHISDPFPQQEKVLLYLVSFVVLLITGPGAYSLDEGWRRRMI